MKNQKILCAVFAFLLCFLLPGCAKDIPQFVPPSQRAVSLEERNIRPDQFFVLAYHDVQEKDPDQAYLSVTVDHLKEQFKWLQAAGYRPVSVSQILDARSAGKPLPARSVLLTFDDGYSGFYKHVLPLLKAYRWPAVLAPVGKWMDTPAGQNVDFGGKPTDRKRFLTWSQIREISDSGLVEIAAHTYNLHYGIDANPQGNTQPAAASRLYNKQTGRYESDSEFKSRIAADVKMISNRIKSATGKDPRVWVWPYGAASGTALDVIHSQGYSMAMTLEDGIGSTKDLLNVPRFLVSNDPTIEDFANGVNKIGAAQLMRVAHVDLDYVYDPDPQQMDRNVGALVQRIADLKISTVFLQAFADPEGDGLVKSVYFQNRVLPVRSDLFNRAAWQLRNRANVQVFAWMPVLSFDLGPSIDRVQRWDPKTGAINIDPSQYRRLSPFDPQAREKITALYEDLARYSTFDGVLFHDDAMLSDFEDMSPSALKAYQQAGLPADISALRDNPETMKAWTRYKSQALTAFTVDLTRHVKQIRGAQIKTARNIFAAPVLQPESEAWFAQNVDDFLQTYDWTAPMAMPRMENVPKGKENAWLDRLVDKIAARPDALSKTVFEIQAKDWRSDAHAGKEDVPVDSATLAQWLKRLQLRGANNFGYYPDDFVNDQPRMNIIRPAISIEWYPFP